MFKYEICNPFVIHVRVHCIMYLLLVVYCLTYLFRIFPPCPVWLTHLVLYISSLSCMSGFICFIYLLPFVSSGLIYFIYHLSLVVYVWVHFFYTFSLCPICLGSLALTYLLSLLYVWVRLFHVSPAFCTRLGSLGSSWASRQDSLLGIASDASNFIPSTTPNCLLVQGQDFQDTYPPTSFAYFKLINLVSSCRW